MKSKKVLLAGVIVAGVIVAGSVAAYSQLRVSNDEIFRRYVTEMAAAKSLAQIETYEGTGSNTVVRGVVDIQNKTSQLVGEVKCSATVEKRPITIKATLAQDGEKTYMRLDDATGTVSDSEGSPIDLASAYANVKGRWYTMSEEDKAIRSMIDNDTYIFNSAVIAPNVNKDKVADTLIRNKAFTYSSILKQGGNYVIKFQAHRSEYQDAIRELFPGMQNTDLILDTVFSDSTTKDSTITVDKSGKFIKETLTDTNVCTDILSTYASSEQSGQASYISGENRPIERSSFTFPAISETKPLESLFEDVVY